MDTLEEDKIIDAGLLKQRVVRYTSYLLWGSGFLLVVLNTYFLFRLLAATEQLVSVLALKLR